MISNLALVVLLVVLVRRALTWLALLPGLNHFQKVRASYCKSVKWSIVLIKKFPHSFSRASAKPICGRPVDNGGPARLSPTAHF
jgi:hypothetical protein